MFVHLVYFFRLQEHMLTLLFFDLIIYISFKVENVERF